MQILIAEDDPVTQRLLEVQLKKWSYDVISTSNGTAAWEALQQLQAPSLAIIDWMMPEPDGLELCRRIRKNKSTEAMYVILLTTKASKEQVVEGLQAGADDYLVKPCNAEEMHARIRAGERILSLQTELAQRVTDLESAMQQIKYLQGIIPICSYCKKIRDDQASWQQLEIYLSEHSDAEFSHGVCPECYEDVVRPEMNAALKKYKANPLRKK